MKQTAPEQFHPSPAKKSGSQIAALCWRMHRGRVQVLLITSRDTGRWIVPKGWPMVGKTAAEAAATEAWEEAGVQGALETDEPIGRYGYDKQRAAKAPLPCDVSVYALRVSALAEKFPERKERRRKWFDARKAARKVAEPELRSLLAGLCLDGQNLSQRPAQEKAT
ncbi:NUDIX hydrolase [Pseudorhodobacter sp. MZDSW-24AT]|uniref:NUDIX hydrolase n=1 Tax=Pseudorhodobacter sp. MZDSW-24AT TaxID=2052957 RepID=UPI000C1E59E5|nr:NUDIX hydrolase [Pseudorhodobacter sp. MZDSW-24AT]PJF11193.1 NUDIX hydrolase [Pseudorhodobacter sp. MZDSW-24AT]